MGSGRINTAWLREQVAAYAEVTPRYEAYADVLYRILKAAAGRLAPLSIIQSRAKSLPSFTEKAIRKLHKYKDPIRDFTDLCGARVIVPSRDEIEPICDFVKSHFEIDWENSEDVGALLRATEFGYRSIHYIVSLRPGTFPTSYIDVSVPDEVFPDATSPMKAEIQVRTLLEHAWSEFAHDRSYKSGFRLPAGLERELATVAALLESADSSLRRINATLRRYSSSYEAYMSREEIEEEIAVLELILGHHPDDCRTAERAGKLAISLGDWQKAIELLTRHADSGYAPVLRDLGVALCKLHRESPESREYKLGQEYLQRAVQMSPTDVDAIASYAGTWKEVDEGKSRELYKRAFDVDPSDPYVLGNVLEHEIGDRGDSALIGMMGPAIRSAIERCREQAEVGVNFPWAFFDLGKFHGLLGEPYPSLLAHLRAVELSTAEFMIDTSLRSLLRMKPALERQEGLEWALRLLELWKAAKFGDAEDVGRTKGLVSPNSKPIEGAVRVLVGWSHVKADQEMRQHEGLLLDAFKDYTGTIIGGGTDTGIGRLAGDIQMAYPTRVYSIGYVPAELPDGAKLDGRYSEIRKTEGCEFSPLQPLRYWGDILASGIDPSSVKVLGIGGNSIAVFEYALAKAMGATVALLEPPGGNAVLDAEEFLFAGLKNLVVLPSDPYVVRAYVGTGLPGLPVGIRESIARSLHEKYIASLSHPLVASPESFCDWDSLPEELKESNRQAVDHISQKLNEIGCRMDYVESGDVAEFSFSEEEIEKLAAMEHARWVAERFMQGWRYGPEKDFAERTNPFLVPWNDLYEATKELDRELVRDLPEFLAQFRLCICRK